MLILKLMVVFDVLPISDIISFGAVAVNDLTHPRKILYDKALVFCLACEAEARHMYFSGGGVVVVIVVGGGVNFFVFRSFSETIRARAMKLGSCIHLEELWSTLCSVLRLDLLFTVH